MQFYKWVVEFERHKPGDLTWGAVLNFRVTIGHSAKLENAIAEAKKILEQEQPQTHHLYRLVSAEELDTIKAKAATA